MAQTIILRGPTQRDLAHRLIDGAPPDTVVKLSEETRTLDQNAKLWAMLSDVARARPEGRVWPPETWKAAFMHFLGHEIMWQPGLDGRTPFPAGFRSSRLTKPQMRDLIECIYAYGDSHGVRWSEPRDERDAA